MVNWDLYEKRLNLRGSTKRDRDINKLQSDIQRKIISSPAHKSGIKIDGVPQSLTIISTSDDDIKRIHSLPNEFFKLGQVIEWTNAKLNVVSSWIITKADFDTEIDTSGKMERCNHLLHFMGTKSQIESRPCIVVDETKYTSGEKDKGVNLILGDTRRNIVIPRDYETLRIKHGTRFLISNNTELPQAFKLTMIDDVTGFDMNDGYINLICTEDQFNPQTDNAELMIADYYSNTVTYKLELLNHDQSTPLLLNAGDTFQLEVQASRNGDICDRSDNLFHSTDESIVTVDSDGLVTAFGEGNCNITITYETQMIVLTVEVQASGVSDAYTISIIDSDNDTEIIYGDDNDVTIKTYKNGVEDSSITFEYELINASGIASIKKVSGNVITISTVDNSKNINKTFELRVWNEELEIEDVKQFKVVAFF